MVDAVSVWKGVCMRLVGRGVCMRLVGKGVCMRLVGQEGEKGGSREGVIGSYGIICSEGVVGSYRIISVVRK